VLATEASKGGAGEAAGTPGPPIRTGLTKIDQFTRLRAMVPQIRTSAFGSPVISRDPVIVS
jgi:hypothetical protein